MRRNELGVVARGAVVVLAVASAFSVVGMFLLRFAPGVVSAFGAVLPWLIKIPTWFYMIALPTAVFAATLPGLGWRRGALALVWASALGFAAELLGTTTGWPFGPYAYGDVLGAKLFGHVPVTIPSSWYAVAVLSLLLAGRVTSRVGARIALGAVYMVLWDVALDPPMSYGFPAWTWQVDGFFYGMPLINLAGWVVTALVMLSGLERVAFRGQLPRTGLPAWPTAVWLTSATLPIGISMARGMGWAVVIGITAVLIPVAAPRVRDVLVRGRNAGSRADAMPADAVLVPVRARSGARYGRR